MSLYENIQFNEGTIALVYDTLNHCINEGMIKTGYASGWLLLNLRVIYFLAIYGVTLSLSKGRSVGLNTYHLLLKTFL